MEDQPVSSVVEDQRKSADVQIVDLVMEMEEAIPVDTKKLEDEVLNKKTSEVFEMVTPKDSGKRISFQKLYLRNKCLHILFVFTYTGCSFN